MSKENSLRRGLEESQEQHAEGHQVRMHCEWCGKTYDHRCKELTRLVQEGYLPLTFERKEG